MTSDIRCSDPASMPFVALTSTAPAGIAGAAARNTARSPCDGTATITWRAPDERFVQRGDRVQERWKRDVGQVGRIGAARRASPSISPASRPHERDVVADARQVDGERGAPASRAKHRCLVSRLRPHPDNSTGSSRCGRRRRTRAASGEAAPCAAITACCRTIARSPTKRYVRTTAGPDGDRDHHRADRLLG